MARILDASTPRGSRPPKKGDAPPADLPPEDEFSSDDESDVPFIEVGGPRAVLKAVPGRLPVPSIIPLPRPAARPEPVVAPAAEPAEDAFAYFRIWFQPLPFPTAPKGSPAERIARELVAVHRPDHAISGEYRNLAHELEQQLAGVSGKALLFTAAKPGAGTTSVLLNLAATLAATAPVVVVDANFARPAVANRLGVAPTPGLREVLARTAPLAWGVQNAGVPNLNVLAHGNRAGEPALDVWPLALDQLRRRFDWVLIDSADWPARPEMPALAATATATYLVLSQAELEQPEWNDLLTEIPRHGAQLRGYILTQK
ncbi:MAG: hypothetical protein ACJ8F7_16585 [Gemmataceae bacterium]